MLIRGRNTVGYTPYPDEVAVAFVKEAARTGVDIFRVFDALNDVDQMLPAIKGSWRPARWRRERFVIRVTWPARRNGSTRWITTCVKQSSWLRRACTSYA